MFTKINLQRAELDLKRLCWLFSFCWLYWLFRLCLLFYLCWLFSLFCLCWLFCQKREVFPALRAEFTLEDPFAVELDLERLLTWNNVVITVRARFWNFLDIILSASCYNQLNAFRKSICMCLFLRRFRTTPPKNCLITFRSNLYRPRSTSLTTDLIALFFKFYQVLPHYTGLSLLRVTLQ